MEKELTIFFFHNEKEITLDLKPQRKHVKKPQNLEQYRCTDRKKTESVMIQLYAWECY